jgi:D-sedoheptulose 7-phosphate isomerase
MPNDIRNHISSYIAGLHSVMEAIQPDTIERVIEMITMAHDEGRQIFVCGNGGSAATASHMACDLGKTTLGKAHQGITKRMRVICLNDNMPLVTAWGNDVGYDVVFAEQLRNLANKGDLLIVVTASGNSPNIIAAVEAAKDLGVRTIGMLGFSGGKVKAMVDHVILAESEDYGFVEDAHLILNHMITAYMKAAVQRT